jgi:hypothetical protein
MTKGIGAALLATTLVLGFSAGISPARAVSPEVRKSQSAQATRINARRRDHFADQRYYPAYYGRPTYYTPAPILPIPPLFGYGWEWW